MAKDAGHLTDGDAAFGNPPRTEPKRSHQWFVGAGEPELFPNKKQAVQASNSKPSSGTTTSNVLSWENSSSFQSVPKQFIDRLFGSNAARSVNFAERNMSPVGGHNMRGKDIDDQFGGDQSAGLSISHTMEDSETFLSYGGFRKVKVNQVKDSDNGTHGPERYSFNEENADNMPRGQAYNRENDTSFISMGQIYDKEDHSVTLMGHPYNRGDSHIRSMGSSYGKADDDAISMGDTYSKGDANIISFGGFPDEHDIIPVGRPVSSYDILYNQSSTQTSETAPEKELHASNAGAVVTGTQVAKSKSASISKNKSEFKSYRKEAPNSFPSNVRSLILTGMLDGVPVKYVSLSREELRGIIKGSGYLCGCQACKYTKVLNAYEFERHAGCKTKHPNNHIFFENGKTIYQIVQELRSTPESFLFDAIQTVFGAPINQKSFLIWKESFQAATRELHRIYGKEKLNI